MMNRRQLLGTSTLLITIGLISSGCDSSNTAGRVIQASVDGNIALVDAGNEPNELDDTSDTTDGIDLANAANGADSANDGPVSVLAACSWSPASPAVFVATNGNDSNSGSVSAPFKTLQKAIAAIRGSATHRIYIRQGTYYVGSTIYLGNKDNGLRINSYPCERATLDGGELLTNWKSLGGNVYSTVVSNPPTYFDFSAFGQRQRFATSGVYDPAQPEISSWQYVESNIKDSSGKPRLDAFKFKAGDLNKADIPYLTGMVSENFAWSRQKESFAAVKSIDWTNRIVYLYSNMTEKPDAGTFRLLNNYRWIRRSGEFAWEWGSTKTLYTRQDNSSFKSSAVLPRLGSIFSITGGNDIQILNLNLQHTHTKGSAIEVKDSSRIAIGGNSFKIVGTAVDMERTTYSSVAGNVMDQLGASGIVLSMGVTNNKIYANKIRHIGQVYKFTAGVSLSGSSDNIVSQNDVVEAARYGISQKDWSPDTINWRNQIINNWVYNACKETGDGGAIETLGRQQNNTGTIIKGNYVEYYNGLGGSPLQKGFKGFGVYLDDKSSGMTLENNIVRQNGFGYAMFYVHGGDNNVIRYNRGVGNHKDNKFVRLEHTFNGTDSSGNTIYDNPKNTRVERNIVYYSSYNGDYSWYGGGGDAIVNYNLLVNTAKFNEYGKAQDANSILTATSPFVNAGSGDFHLKSGSDAGKLSIPEFEWSKLGAGNFKPNSTFPRFW